MLPKEHRLPLRTLPDFFSTAHKQHSRLFTFFYKTTPSVSQLAVIIPKKAISKATERNKYKRRLRQMLKPLIVNKNGIQLAVVAKPSLLAASNQELEKELLKHYDRITQNLPSN